MAIDKYIGINELDSISGDFLQSNDYFVVSLNQGHDDAEYDYVAKKVSQSVLVDNIVGSTRMQNVVSSLRSELSGFTPAATTTHRGGFVVYSGPLPIYDNQRNYTISVGLSDYAYVNVPWKDITIASKYSEDEHPNNYENIATIVLNTGSTENEIQLYAQSLCADQFTQLTTTVELSSQLSNYIRFNDKNTLLSSADGITIEHGSNDVHDLSYLTLKLHVDDSLMNVAGGYLAIDTNTIATKDFVRLEMRALSALSNDTLSTSILDVPVLTPMFMDYIPANWIDAAAKNWVSGSIYQQAYAHLSSDLAEAKLSSTLETESYNGHNMTYWRALDGHKIVEISSDLQKSTIKLTFDDIYDATGTSWYYLLDTNRKEFIVPVTKYGFQGRAIRQNTYNKPGTRIDAGLPSLPNIISSLNVNSTNSQLGSTQDVVKSVTYSSIAGRYNLYGKSTTVLPPAVGMYLVFNGGYIGSNFVHRDEVYTDTWKFYDKNNKLISSYYVLLSKTPMNILN